jgi:hypothetical protein
MGPIEGGLRVGQQDRNDFGALADGFLSQNPAIDGHPICFGCWQQTGLAPRFCAAKIPHGAQ